MLLNGFRIDVDVGFGVSLLNVVHSECGQNIASSGAVVNAFISGLDNTS